MTYYAIIIKETVCGSYEVALVPDNDGTAIVIDEAFADANDAEEFANSPKVQNLIKVLEINNINI